MRLRAIFLALAITLTPAFPVVADQRLSDLLLQIQRLQEEVQQLRGKLEEQQHQISILESRQRDQYMDLDARLQGRSSITPARGGVAGATGIPPTPRDVGSERPSEEKQAYHIAFDLLKQRRYEDAARAFEDLLVRYPNGEFTDNARYWLGEARYVKRDYSAAMTEFQRVLARYPLSPKVPGSMLKIGYIHYDQGDWLRARTTLQDVIAKFPGSNEARLAKSRLERIAREGH